MYTNVRRMKVDFERAKRAITVCVRVCVCVFVCTYTRDTGFNVG